MPETVELLKTKFVPVAIDQAYQRRQKDTEGDFYRKIAGQGPRDLKGTTQGFYIATPTGKLLLYNNNRDPKKVLRLMKEKLDEFDSLPKAQKSTTAIENNKIDKQYNPKPPKGGLVVRVRAKVLAGYEPTDDFWLSIFQNAVSRDNLWISKSEHQQLAAGKVPAAMANRMARFHLVDNTRGEPPMWKENEIRTLNLQIEGNTLIGDVHLETKNGDRGYKAKLFGKLKIESGKVTKFDVAVKGNFWGEGRYTKRAPKGKFPLAITFTLADGSDAADAIPPQGSRGWVPSYIKIDN